MVPTEVDGFVIEISPETLKLGPNARGEPSMIIPLRNIIAVETQDAAWGEDGGVALIWVRVYVAGRDSPWSVGCFPTAEAERVTKQLTHHLVMVRWAGR